MAKKSRPKTYLNVITVVPGPSLSGRGADSYETLRDTVEGTLRDDDLLAEFRFPEGITVTDQIAMLYAAAEDLQQSQTGSQRATKCHAGKPWTEFRFVAEDVANKLRFAESVALTVLDALRHGEYPSNYVLTLLHGANELTAAIGTLDHAVENAKLVGTRLVVPPRA